MAKILGQLEKHSAKTRNSCGSSKPSTLVRLVWAWYVGVHSPKYSYKNHQGIGDQLIAMDSQKRNMHPNSMRCFLTQKQKWLCDQQLLRWSRNIYGLQRERCLPASTLTLTAPLTDTTTCRQFHHHEPNHKYRYEKRPQEWSISSPCTEWMSHANLYYGWGPPYLAPTNRPPYQIYTHASNELKMKRKTIPDLSTCR